MSLKILASLPVLALLLTITGAGCRKAAIEATREYTTTVPWADSSNRHPRNGDYVALINKYQKLGFPGIALLIRDRHGTWVGSAGKADIDRGIPFGVGQVSKIASITKYYLGLTIFRIIEDSANTRLGYGFLNDPISKWLPASVVDKIPNGNLITLGDCMKHETGIPDVEDLDPFYLALVNQPVRVWELEDIVSFVYGMKPLFKPREKASYSNTNTTIVAMVAEAATGMKHAELIKKYLTRPLNMRNTFYQYHDALPANTAQGYYDLYNNGTLANVSNIVTASGNGYGGMFSDIFDMYKVIDAVYLKRTFLSQQSLVRMNSFGAPDEPNRYGYGSMLKYISRGVDAGIGHSGRDLGYSANLFYFPNRNVSHAFIINYGTNGDSRLRAVFRQFEQELMDITFQ